MHRLSCLLHGFPSSSQMFEPLFARLGDDFRLIAPDYPGFGYSDAPDPKTFAYTFNHLSAICRPTSRTRSASLNTAFTCKITEARSASA